jgi:hypothetical protein
LTAEATKRSQTPLLFLNKTLESNLLLMKIGNWAAFFQPLSQENQSRLAFWRRNSFCTSLTSTERASIWFRAQIAAHIPAPCPVAIAAGIIR